ncbi:MAG: DMT family transporter [Hyphomicrobiales bacterium]
MKTETKAILALLVTTLIWGMAPVCTRLLAVELKPANALVIRYAAVTLIFAAVLAWTGGWRIDLRDWPRLLFISLIGMLGYNLGSVYGFELAPASIGGLIVGTQPLLILLVAAAVAQESPRAATIAGVAIATIGTVLLFWNDLHFAAGRTDMLRGAVLIFLSGVAWAFYVVGAKPLIERYGALTVSGGSIIIATLPMLALGSSETVSALAGMTAVEWGAMAFMVILSTFVASITWNYGAGHLPAAAAGPFLYLVPVLAVAAGAAILDEPVSANILAGGALILTGVAVAEFGGRARIARLRQKQGTKSPV